MKKYICLLIAVTLAFAAYKLGWYASGNEAIAATKQVLRGDEFIIGRIEQEAWVTIKSWTEIVAGLFGLLSAYFFISEKRNKTETNTTKQ